MKCRNYFFLAAIVCSLASSAFAKSPNIVIIYTDDQGYADVGVFGAKGFATLNEELAG